MGQTPSPSLPHRDAKSVKTRTQKICTKNVKNPAKFKSQQTSVTTFKIDMHSPKVSTAAQSVLVHSPKISTFAQSE